MATDGSGLETHEAQSSSVLRTKELFVKGNNVDPITGFPFETPEVRRKIIDIFRDAISGHGTVAFVDGDIDGLKVLNDKLGHEKTNGVIKVLVTNREAHLSETAGAEAVYVYRPQAGGDEFRAIIVCSDDTPVEKLKAELENILAKPISVFDTEVHSSSGVVINQFNGSENPPLVFQSAQERAEGLMTEKKANKIVKEIENTADRGSSLSLDDYIKEIQKRWGNKRTSPEALRIFLYHVAAKATSRALFTRT